MTEEGAALLQRAREAAEWAYCPYSRYAVGAAVDTDRGVFCGCNVENASFGLSMCAERNAVAAARVAGARVLTGLALWTVSVPPAAPCGACRQVLAEFMSDSARIWLADGTVRTLGDLLPYAFSRSAIRCEDQEGELYVERE